MDYKSDSRTKANKHPPIYAYAYGSLEPLGIRLPRTGQIAHPFKRGRHTGRGCLSTMGDRCREDRGMPLWERGP